MPHAVMGLQLVQIVGWGHRPWVVSACWSILFHRFPCASAEDLGSPWHMKDQSSDSSDAIVGRCLERNDWGRNNCCLFDQTDCTSSRLCDMVLARLSAQGVNLWLRAIIEECIAATHFTKHCELWKSEIKLRKPSIAAKLALRISRPWLASNHRTEFFAASLLLNRRLHMSYIDLLQHL